jgi:uncharacterized membrane protein
VRRILTAEPVNAGRQPELDMARGLAVLFMIAVHTLMVFANDQVRDSWFGQIVDFLGSPPAAPVFMFLLGTGLVFSRRSDPRSLFRRGLLLLGLGYVLTALRLVLPLYVALALGHDPGFPIKPSALWFMQDILHFAGLALMFFGGLKSLVPHPSPALLIGIGVGLGLTNSLLLNLPGAHPDPAVLTGLLWGSSQMSFFPFLSWIIYPLAGYVFGLYLLRASDKRLFYSVLFFGSTGLFIPLYALFTDLFHVTIAMDGDPYYHHNALVGILFLLFVLSWISLLYFTTQWFRWPEVVQGAISRWSCNVTAIYFIHWILIGWLMVVTGLNRFGFLLSIMTFAMVAVASDAIAWWYANRSRT